MEKQQFLDGVQGDLRDMLGMGGPVDDAVITTSKGCAWINKKRLKVGDFEIDREPDLKIKTNSAR